MQVMCRQQKRRPDCFPLALSGKISENWHQIPILTSFCPSSIEGILAVSHDSSIVRFDWSGGFWLVCLCHEYSQSADATDKGAR